LLVASVPAAAQPLADRVPADAVLYVGWAGAESMGPGFDESHLKALLESAEVGRWVNEVVPRLLEVGRRQQPMLAEMGSVPGLLAPMWRHPTALYVGPVDLAGERGPVPRVAILCDAGAEAGAFQQKLQRFVQEQGAGNAPFPIVVRKAGNVVALVIGKTPELDAVLAGKGKGKTIQTVKSFAAAMSAQKSPVVAGYVDAEAIIRFADKMVAGQADAEVKEGWPAARDALGLAGLKRLSFAMGFDGKDWGTHAFIEAPAPRKGLLAMMEAEPVGDDVLRAIPSTATMAGVARADLGRMFDAIRAMVGELDEEAGREIDEGVKQVNAALSLDVRQDILGSLGDQWAYYIAPEVTGRGPLGIVVVNRVGDAAKAQASWEKLQELANGVIGEQLPPDMKVSFKQAKVGDVTVQYLATPFVTPSWTIQNGNLYLGLYPQLVAGAAGHVSREGKSILDNEGFVALRKRLGDQPATAYQFYDLPRSAPTNYQFWLVLSSLGKFGDLTGVDTPAMPLPPMATLAEHLSVAGSVTWVDAAGWHFRGVTPFPGGTVVASETAGAMDVQTIGILAGVLLPSLQRAREQATRVQSMANLRQIGFAAMMYANEHKGRLPDDLAGTREFIENPHVYANPRSGVPLPPDVQGDDLNTWINESSGYVYVASGKSIRDRADVVVAHERPDGLSDGLGIVFLDGHVEFQNMPQAMQTIEAARGAGAGAKDEAEEDRRDDAPGDNGAGQF
jgi:type II secretory pathway pseudopilin PulG